MVEVHGPNEVLFNTATDEVHENPARSKTMTRDRV